MKQALDGMSYQALLKELESQYCQCDPLHGFSCKIHKYIKEIKYRFDEVYEI